MHSGNSEHGICILFTWASACWFWGWKCTLGLFSTWTFSQRESPSPEWGPSFMPERSSLVFFRFFYLFWDGSCLPPALTVRSRVSFFNLPFSLLVISISAFLRKISLEIWCFSGVLFGTSESPPSSFIFTAVPFPFSATRAVGAFCFWPRWSFSNASQ